MPNLDPKPYRFSTNPTIRYERLSDAARWHKAFFEPREGYEQDRAKYPS